MGEVIISEKKERALADRMASLGILGSDLEESFVCSSGAGGQHVNKVATCVVLRYRPTGLVVKCQKERSQALNRYWARRILTDRIESERLGRESEEARRIAKIRRQKRKRSKRAKDKLLAVKKKHGALKKLRARPAED